MRLHTINYWRLRHRVIIRDTLIIIAVWLCCAAMLYGMYAFGSYMADKLHENKTLAADNKTAMLILSGERYTVDGVEYRVEEVKQKQLIGGL